MLHQAELQQEVDLYYDGNKLSFQLTLVFSIICTGKLVLKQNICLQMLTPCDGSEAEVKHMHV